jgi:peptidoglycan/LPS O-acetylase OafA/YrhL
MTVPAILPRSQRAPKTSRLGLAAFIIVAVVGLLYVAGSAWGLITQMGSEDSEGWFLLVDSAGYLFVPGLLAVIFGHVGMAQEKRQGWKSNLSLTGLIAGYVFLVTGFIAGLLQLLFVVAILGFLALLFTGGNLPYG